MPHPVGAASRLVVSTALISVAFLTGADPAPAQAQDLPPSLQGEFFQAAETPFTNIGSVDTSGECTAAVGETFTLPYEASGPATGPYPGTFTESGTVTGTMTSQFLPTVAFGVLLTWDAEFEIDSPVGDVTGTKRLLLGTLSHAQCVDGAIVGVGGEAVDQELASGSLEYEATITPPTGGTFTDAGRASALVFSGRCTGTACSPVADIFTGEVFSEGFFLSTGVLPVDTSGKATGGGQIVDVTNPLESVTFGFNVRKSEDRDRLNGMCNVLDHATGTHVKCLTVTDYQQIGNTATWEGTAEVDGVEEEYRITVQDNGEPNSGLDTFSIVTETYEAAGNVQHGNVQVHQDEIGL